MPTFSSFKAYSAEWEKVARELDATQRRKITHEQAQAGQKIADKFARRDLGGDRAFPNWNRGNRIAADTKIKPLRNDATLIAPTRSGAGIWTTIDQGRNQGNASGFSGPGINTRTGVTSRTKAGGLRKVRARKAKRWNGVTQGKDTAKDAVAEMERELSKIAARLYRKTLVKHFDVT